MDDGRWYRVENLHKMQEESEKRYKLGCIDNRNDFHSYKLLNDGNDLNSAIASHNVTGQDADYVAESIMNTIKRYDKRHGMKYHIESCADLGGGCGFLAHSVQKYCKRVFSYDIAKEATIYGKNHFKEITFITKGVTNEEQFEEGPFDLVLAYEFYPFTRTDDWEYQQGYIDMCLANLNQEGILVIGLPGCRHEVNLLKNKKKIYETYRKNGVEIVVIPHLKIHRVVKNWIVAQCISRLINLFHDAHYFIVLRK